MRSLKFLLLLFVGSNAFAFIQTVSTTTSYQSVTGSADPGNLLGNTRVSQVQKGVQYKLEGLLEKVTLSGGLTDSSPDYSNYLIVQKNGISIPLSSLVSQNDELSTSLNASFNSGPHNLSVGYMGNLNSSPFATQMFNLEYLETFFNKTTGLGAKAIKYQTDQPATYYIDLNFQSQLRPTTVHGSEYSVYWDQVLSERWKSYFELSTGIRDEDRPRNIGETLKEGYALTDRFFGQVALTHIAELTSEKLKDERGYFTLNAAEISLTYEPWIDFLATGSYGYVVESEVNPSTGQSLQVGSDQYGLGFKYRKGRLAVDFSTAAKFTNTNVQDLTFQGGLSWQI